VIDPRARNLARLLVRYSVNVQPEDRVSIGCYGSLVAAMPLMVETVREVLKAGAHPHFQLDQVTTEEFGNVFFAEATPAQIAHVDPFAEMVAREFQCEIIFVCESNSRRFSRVDPERRVTRSRAYSKVTETYFERAGRGALRWVAAGVPTQSYAQDAEMSLEDYEDFVFSAAFADTEDPVSAWEEMGRRQARIVDWLAGKKHVDVKGEHIDLSFQIEGRKFINDAGRANMPDGEIFTGPVEDTVNGWFKSTYPAVFGGVDVGQVSLRFEKGVVVHAEAEKNAGYLLKLLDTDEGARRLGEFGIGTNDRIRTFTNNMLFDEKMAGTIHAAIGLGYPESGSTNKSAIHWDFLCDMKDGGQIIVDGQPFYDSGKFLVPGV
jgi:aminopeptidase